MSRLLTVHNVQLHIMPIPRIMCMWMVNQSQDAFFIALCKKMMVRVQSMKCSLPR